MADIVLAEPNIALPPTQADLPYDDGVPMESWRHKVQMDLLIDALGPWLAERADGFVGGNMFVYYSLAQVKHQDFRGPDFFAALGVPKGERRSWVVWEEGKAPDVVIELLSDSTAKVDKSDKKRIYQNQMRVSEYFWFDPFNAEDWSGFSLRNGVYQPLALNDRGQMISPMMGLSLVRWHGSYKGIGEIAWLRWATLEGELLLVPQEIAEQERQRAEQERQRAEQVELQLQQVALNLLQNAMSVEQVVQLTGLSETQVRNLQAR